jgi:hypothetical protein
MSTNAIIKFADDRVTYFIYKQCDGYPSEVIKCINNALSISFKLPRYEADEFACSFIAANKQREGHLYLLNKTEYEEIKYNIHYMYVVQMIKSKLQVKIYEVDFAENHILIDTVTI